MVSIKIILVKILQNFQVSCKTDQLPVKDLLLSSDISVRARDGNKVIVSARK